MKYRPLSLRCHCGETPDIAEVGLTDDHSLVIHWWCKQCHKLVYSAKSLADCWRDCPDPNGSPNQVVPIREFLTIHEVIPKSRDDSYLEQDAEFLRSIGVRA